MNINHCLEPLNKSKSDISFNVCKTLNRSIAYHSLLGIKRGFLYNTMLILLFYCNPIKQKSLEFQLITSIFLICQQTNFENWLCNKEKESTPDKQSFTIHLKRPIPSFWYCFTM